MPDASFNNLWPLRSSMYLNPPTAESVFFSSPFVSRALCFLSSHYIPSFLPSDSFVSHTQNRPSFAAACTLSFQEEKKIVSYTPPP